VWDEGRFEHGVKDVGLADMQVIMGYLYGGYYIPSLASLADTWACVSAATECMVALLV
jgi:hypothetical protein